MKEIVYRGGMLTFRLPETWQEEHYADGGAAFFEDDGDSGTLNLSLTTARRSNEVDVSALKDVIMGDAAPGDPEPETLPNGNMLRRFERPDKNQGKPLHLSYWLLGNLVPPKTIRLALFGFAVLEAEAASETHQQKVAMLDHQIRGTVLTSLTPEEIQARVAGQEKRTWWRFW